MEFRVTMHTVMGAVKSQPTDLLETLKLVEVALINGVDLDVEVTR